MQIFLSYRRDDTQWLALKVFDELRGRYGRQNVFFDLEAVPTGVRYRDLIKERISRSSAFVLLIGKNWTSLTDEYGNRRIDDPLDPVRFEVKCAIQMGVPIIPVRVDGARMPRKEELDESIASLLDLNAAEVS